MMLQGAGAQQLRGPGTAAPGAGINSVLPVHLLLAFAPMVASTDKSPAYCAAVKKRKLKLRNSSPEAALGKPPRRLLRKTSSTSSGFDGLPAPQPAVDLANKRDRKQEIKKRQKVYEKGRKYDNDIGRLQREIEQLKDVKGKDSLAKRYHYLQGRYDTLFRITTFLIRRSNVDCDDIDLSAFAESCGIDPLAADDGSEALLCHDMPTAVDVVPALTDATTSVAHPPTDTITTSEVS